MGTAALSPGFSFGYAAEVRWLSVRRRQRGERLLLPLLAAWPEAEKKWLDAPRSGLATCTSSTSVPRGLEL
jgi:hypothetical protein